MKKINKKSNELKLEKLNKAAKDDVLVFVQCVLLPVLLILSVCTLFIKELSIVTEVILGLLLFVMGTNNYRRFKRKYFTIIYFVVGILVIALTLYAVLNNAI